MDINYLVNELVAYGLKTELIAEADETYATSRLLEILSLYDFKKVTVENVRELHIILSEICDYAFENGLIEQNGIVYRDLFDTKITGTLVDRPSSVIKKFYDLYESSPKKATDYFYKLACDSNYIRTERIKKDLKWTHDSEYGKIDISVNLSKPEKDPKAIEVAKLMPQTDYPKCALCHENEGFEGTLTKAARQNLRQIPFDMAGCEWYLQYSPYVYYNEHCIALSKEHIPMKVNIKTVEKILNFLEKFPHYFIGSNAGLPIVGGSILAHDHMQGGCYELPMARAKEQHTLKFAGFEDVHAVKINWPMAVIRIRHKDKSRVLALADKIFKTWEKYTDEEAGIFAFTNGEPHNAITPIGRRRGEEFELDLALRNNLTSDEFPLGIYHPHPERHNIKKENIGLIEVAGLAILPSRLKNEIEEMKKCILSEKDFDTVENLKKHKAWFEGFKDSYNFTDENVESVLKTEIGKTFVRILEDASVFKNNDSGIKFFMRYIDFVNNY